MQSRTRTSMLSRPLLVFMGTMVLANIASRMTNTLMPLYVKELGADLGQIGLYFTLASIAPLAFQILGGWLSDQIGRIQAVAIGSLAGVLGYVCYIFAPNWQWLLLSSVGMAIAVSFVAPSWQAYVAEQSAEEHRGKVFGLTNAIFTITGIIGPPLAGILSEVFGFRWMFAVGGLLYGLATIIRLGMAARERKNRPAGAGKAARARLNLSSLKASLAAMTALLLGGGVLTWIFLSDGARDFSYRIAFDLLPVYQQEVVGLTNTQIGLLSSVNGIIVMALLAPGGWLADRFGERVGIVVGFAVTAGSIFLMTVSHNFASFVLAWAVLGVGEALISPAYDSLISKVTPVHLRGTAFGLFSTSLGVLSLPAPWIGAQLWQRVSPQMPFYVPLVVTVLMLPVMWVKFRLPRPASSAPVEATLASSQAAD